MQVHLVLLYRGASVEVDLAVDDPRACVADLTQAFDGPGDDRLGLVVDGRWFGPDAGLDEVGLYEGAVVELAPRVAPLERAALPRAGLVLAVVGGPSAGRTFALGPGAVTIGRDRSCAVVIDDPALSRQHARIDNAATITDLASTNGTWIDDAPVIGPTPLPTGALVRVGATQLQLRPDDDTDRPVGLPIGGAVPFNRPPRAAPAPPAAPLVAPSPPKASGTTRAFGIAVIVGPILMGAGMVVIYGNPRFALFAALAPVIALVNWIASKRATRKERRRHHRAFAATLEQFAADLAARANDERGRRDELLADPAEVVRRAVRPSVRLWQRRPDHDDFLRLRAGIGDAPWQPVETNGRDAFDPAVTAMLETHARLARAPIEVDLSHGGVVGIVGERRLALAVARSLVVQAAVHHGPADLGVAVFGGDDWDWTKWLPHLEPNALDDDPSNDRALLAVVDDGAALKGRRAPVRELLRRQSGIVIAATEDQLPATCSSIIELRDDVATADLRRPHDRLHLRDFVIAGLDDDTARECARHLARFEDPELELTGAGLPDSVRLLPLLGIDDPTPDAIRALWASDDVDPAPSTPIGVDDDGIVHIDLLRDGPHGLIGGTTGSGKSELLRSLVAGMAARVDPEHLVFVLVDYKGGSAFDECSRLPHVVGLVTDLDEQLAERALRSLEAELRHRERTLRDAGAADLPAYLRSGSTRGPLPRLVVVIDEFATMANELPDFVGALVGIAQRGRSLGVHLLLATQRPSGAVNANIKANTNLRIALRVQDAADSTDIVDRASASTISRATPGRAYVRRGPADVVLAQTALSTAARRQGEGAAVRVSPFRLQARDDDTPGAGDDGVSELTLLVDAIRAAFDGRTALRQPWLPMLPERVALAELNAAGPGVVAFALADEPDDQRQVPAGWLPADGHLALYGMVGSGTTTALLSVVEALVRRSSPHECHVYAVDFGANGLDALRPLPHVGAVITASEREAQTRLVQHLRAEVDRRRMSGATTPLIVTCIDGIGAFLAEYDGIDGTEVADAFRRVFSEGPAVGITFVLTADRVGALPLRLASLVSQKLLFRLADVADYATLGLRPAQLPRFVPGRAVHSNGNRVVQVALPGDLATLAGPRVAPTIGTLPTEVALAALPAGSIEGPCIVPLGVADDDLDVAALRVHDGEHVLVTGPPRSGKTNALAVMAHTIRAADPHTVLLAVCEPRSLLHDVTAFDAVGSLEELAHIVRAAATDPRRWFVMIDDAATVDDPDGIITSALRSSRSDLHVVAAGRADEVRAAYGHWLRVVRQSRTGLLLQPDLAADGDLLGVRLPRRVAVPLGPGRGFMVDNGEVRLLQVAGVG